MPYAAYISFILPLLSYHCAAVSGDGHVTLQKRSVRQVNRLTIDGPFQIITSDDPSSDFFIATEADENLQPYIEVSESGLSTSVRLRPGIIVERYQKLAVHVDARTIQWLTIHAVTAQRSDITLPVACHGGALVVEGSIPLSVTVRVVCHHVSHLSGPGGHLHPSGINYARLLAEIRNAQTTTLSGDIEEAAILHEGSGQLSAFGLRADLLRIRHTATAAAEIYSDHELQITGEGSGTIYYGGSASVTALDLKRGASACHEQVAAVAAAPIAALPRTPSHRRDFNTDSLFAEMIVRDQAHRRSAVTAGALADDSLNFILLSWYLDKYGFPVFEADSLEGMSAALFMHIDSRVHFERIKDILLQAVRDGRLMPNTYAYTCDRSMIAAKSAPVYYYFPPGSDFDLLYEPNPTQVSQVNRVRAAIGLPPYHRWLHGKYF